MASPLILKIAVDDKGNPAIINLGKNAQRTQKVVAPLGSVMKAVFASAAVLKGIAMLNTGLRSAIRNAMEYELNLKRLGAIGGLAGEQLAELGSVSRQLATETEHSAASIVKAGLEIKKMGFTAKETLTALPTVVDLSTAAMTDLTWAAKNAMTTLRAFGLEADELDRVANVMAKTVVSTGIDFEDFTESMKFIAPIAKTVGMSLEETSAMMGILGNTAIKGSLGGTTLKNMFLNILKPSDRVRDMLGKMNTEGMTFSSVLKALKDGGADVNDFLETFNKRAVAGSLHLANVSEEVNTLQQALEDQGKTVADIADEIRDTTTIAVKQFINNLQEVVLSMWDAFGDRPKDLVHGLTESVKELDKWVDNNQEVIKQWGDTFTKSLKFLGGTGVGVIKLFANNLRLVALAIAAINAKWILLRVDAMISGIAKAGSAAGTAAGGFNAMQGAIGLVVIAGFALIDWLDRWNAKLDQQMKNVAEMFRSREHLEMLEKLQEAYGKAKVANEKLLADRKGMIELDKTQIKNLKVQIGTLENLEKGYESTFGKPALDRIKDNNSALKNEIRNLKIILDHVDKIDKKTDPKKKTTFDFGAIPPAKDKTKKTIEDRIAADAQKAWMMFIKEEDRRNESKIKRQKKADADIAKQADEAFQMFLDEETKRNEKAAKLREETKRHVIDSAFSMAQSTFDIMSNFNQMALNNTLKRLDKEEKATERRHDLEVAYAGDSTFRKIIAEEKYQQAKEKIDKEREQIEAQARQKEKRFAILKATADAAQAIIGTVADTKGGVISRTAAGAIMGAIAFGYVAQLTAAYASYRAGSQGLVQGQGNVTSDSNLARVSKGERVLSDDEIKSMGGNERIQQMIDRGAVYNTSNKVTVHVDTFIGTQGFVSDTLIPAIEKELTR